MSVTTTLDGHVAVLTIEDPEHHNALSVALVRDLLGALRELDRTPARAIVIAGKGRFFSAGANIPDLLEAGWLSGRADPGDPVALFETLASHRLPVIAAVAGPALGGGFELCLSCDLVVAATTAWFATPEVGLGVVPNTAMARLAAMVGSRRALEIMLTRRRVPASEALALGFVNQVVAPEDVITAAVGLARQIVDGAPPGALQVLKQGMARHVPPDWPEVRAHLARLPEEEWREGLAAFVGKRAPDYEKFWDQAAKG